jgi:hypothetical protein|tara:strand:- start:35486 stop:35803 length:318 start_codon:yes stop_codon:yes gene_type:complete
VKIKVANIKVYDELCWRCGCSENLTNHHAIPKFMNPLQNVQIPLCRDCHDELHTQDMSSINAYTYRLQKKSEELVSSMKCLGNMIKVKKSESEKVTVGDLLKVTK